MASSTEATKVLCVVCNKAKGIYKCEGCSRSFCAKHSIDHRNDLNKQLEEVTVTHDLVHQTLNQQEAEDPQQHPLLKKINQWEEKSIKKIRQTAEKARKELFKGATQHTTQVKQKLQLLSNELRQGREENVFSEINLQQWTQKLEELKKELLNSTTIAIQEDSTPLVPNIRIDLQDTSDVFERICGNARIKDHGQLAMKGNSNSHTEIRGKREYTSGRHILRFQIELLSGNLWIFFGIITKSQSMQLLSYNSASTHGWATEDQIYVCGQNIGGQSLKIAQNDYLTLWIDCNQRQIELKNEQTNQTMQMSIDISKCPFPWQFHLNLYVRNTRVRILP